MSSAQRTSTKLKTRELDSREIRFVEEYVCGRHADNATKAGIAAGYSQQTAMAYCRSWVRPDGEKPWVYDAVVQRREEIKKKLELSSEDIIREISRIALGNIASFVKLTSSGEPYVDMSDLTYDEMAVLSDLQIEDYVEGRGEDAREVRRIKFKLHDKQRALELLAKISGLLINRTLLGNDPNNPLPGTEDLSRLSPDKLLQLRALHREAAGLPPVDADVDHETDDD